MGRLRAEREAVRGGVSLPIPEQEVDVEGDRWHLEFRPLVPVELWNAQISLLTGFAAAYLMVDGAVGVLRTLPPPDPRDVQRLRRTARALHIDWPDDQAYPEFIRGLDPSRPAHAAMVVACTRLLRGSGYVAFNGEVPDQSLHSALASEYAHVTAPLRRLVDRYAGEICVALCAGTEIPAWVVDGMSDVPTIMSTSGRKASAYESAVVDLVEAALLAPRVGETFDGVIVEVVEKDPKRGVVTVDEPAVEARLVGEADLPLGTEARVELTTADVAARKVEFTLRA